MASTTRRRRSPRDTPPTRGRTGPRGGDADTRADILAAARDSFSHKGYSGTTLRAVAQSAGVDVALIYYYFGSKENLFAASMELPVRPEELIEAAFAEGAERAGPRLVEMFLDLWEDPTTGPSIRTLFRSATTHEESRRALSEFATAAILGRYVAHLSGPDARRRAALAASQLVGMAMLRYLIRIEPAASMPREQLVADLGPTVQRYLTGPLAAGPFDVGAAGPRVPDTGLSDTGLSDLASPGSDSGPMGA